MYHTIEFNRDIILDVEISPKHRLERLKVRRGTRIPAQLRPYVIELSQGPVEVADLFFEDGAASRMVFFEYFAFAE
jgi:hypothetical protein